MQPDEVNITKEPSDKREQQEPLVVHLSLLLGTPVVDAAGHSLGRVREVAITPGVQPPVVSALIWGPKDHPKAVAPTELAPISGGGLRLQNGASPRSFSMGEP